MRSVRKVLCVALALFVAHPAMLPVEFGSSDARSRAKSQKSKRASAKRETPKRSSAPSETASLQKREQLAATAAPALGAPGVLVQSSWPLALSLSANQPLFKNGDTLSITALSDAPCDLTVVSIDSEGFAVVLFPNEYEPDNQLNGNEPKQIPRADAPYQLRTEHSGTETILGICAPPGTRPHGIVADYERYRFTLLGNWSDFTSNIPAKEVEIIKTHGEEHRTRRRLGNAPLDPLLPPSEPSSQGRAVLLLQVE